jgi:hypothetical protein
MNPGYNKNLAIILSFSSIFPKDKVSELGTGEFFSTNFLIVTGKMKTDFYITYHHSDEMAARWIAAELKQAQFSTLSDSWDFFQGETPLEKIEHTLSVSRSVMVLISRQFLQSQVLNKSFLGVQGAIFLTGGAACPPLVAEGIVFLVRIDACEIEKVLGTGSIGNRFEEWEKLYPGESVRYGKNHVSHLCCLYNAGP